MKTYGLGIAARSSKELAKGVCDLTAGLKGLGCPSGLSGLLPACLSLKEIGGAKSAGSNTIEFSVSLCGVGRDWRGAGGAIGFLGAGSRPLIEDIFRGVNRGDEGPED